MLDPKTFAKKIDNPYFPLIPGTTSTYSGKKDKKNAVDIVEVTNNTKKILGVACREVHDRLYLNGALAEETLDWYAQDRAGTVWYFGEATRTLNPAGRVVSTEESFRAGVNGARPGIMMPAHPTVGATYQQEYYKGHAEDHFKVMSMSANVTVPAGSYKDTLLTNEWTPLEPGALSGKNYARGVGTIREFDIRGGDEHLELVTIRHS